MPPRPGADRHRGLLRQVQARLRLGAVGVVRAAGEDRAGLHVAVPVCGTAASADRQLGIRV